MKRFLFVCWLGLSIGRSENPTTSPSTSLAPGIVYTQDLAASLPPDAYAVVYDLRDHAPTPSPSNARVGPLAPNPAALSVVLLGADAPASAFERFARRSHRVLLLAPLGAPVTPDVSLPVTPEEVAAALEAIQSGADLSSQATPEIAKRRFDEATLVRRHNGTADPARSSPEPAAESSPPESATPPVAPDLMLQRAVQILQGLHALGRG